MPARSTAANQTAPPNRSSDFGVRSGGNAKDAWLPGWRRRTKAPFGTAASLSPAATATLSEPANHARSRASDQANFSQPAASSAALAGTRKATRTAMLKPMRRMTGLSLRQVGSGEAVARQDALA